MELNLKKEWTNNLTDRIKEDLHFRSTTTSIKDIDFKKYLTDKNKVSNFHKLVKQLQIEKEIDSKEIRGFKIIVEKYKIAI